MVLKQDMVYREARTSFLFGVSYVLHFEYTIATKRETTLEPLGIQKDNPSCNQSSPYIKAAVYSKGLVGAVFCLRADISGPFISCLFSGWLFRLKHFGFVWSF